jgi:signal transduction histidine kinase
MNTPARAMDHGIQHPRPLGSRLVAGALRGRSIRWKLVGIILLLSLFGLSVVFAGMTINTRIQFQRTLAHDLAVLAEISGNNSRAALLFDDPAAAAEILAALSAKPRVVQAILYDAQDRQFAEYRNARAASLPPVPGTLGEMSGFRDGHYMLIQDVRVNERRVGRLYLASSLQAWGELLRNYIVVFVLLTVLTVALTLALALLLQRVITSPIAHLVETAREISLRNDYGLRAVKTTDDELGILVGAFNSMLDEIQNRDAELVASHALLEDRVRERTVELEAANRELEAFSYSVSHDLRAPLRAMDGFSKAVHEGYAEHLDERGKDYLQRVRAASQRMGQLIDDMLRLSRITRSELRRSDVDLGAQARELVAELRQRDPGRNVEVTIEPEMRVRADPELMRVMLDNLLGNAWKFTNRHQQAHIAFGRLQKDGETVYYVRDNGAGFDMAYAGKLFGAFQRLHGHDEFEGTGIGLATVQRIVHRHGGRVWAEAEVGRGAAFYFTLPLKSEAP